MGERSEIRANRAPTDADAYTKLLASLSLAESFRVPAETNAVLQLPRR